MTDKKNLTAVELRDDIDNGVITLASEIAPKLSIDDNGVGTTDDSLFESTLPEGVTLDTVKTVQKHITKFTDSVGLAFGEKSIETMKANKDIQRTTLRVPVGNMTTSALVDRKKIVSNPQDRSKPLEFHANLVAGTEYRNAKKKGNMGKTVKYLRALGDEEFS